MDVIAAFENASGLNLKYIGAFILMICCACYLMWSAWAIKGFYGLFATGFMKPKDLMFNIFWCLSITLTVTFMLGISLT